MLRLKQTIALVGIGGLMASSALAQQVTAVVQKPTITAEAAMKIAQVCVGVAKQRNSRQAISILDASGEEVLFYRMDGTTKLGTDTSRMKAKAAFLTRRIGRDMKGINVPLIYEMGGLPSPGGIPIKQNDVLIGAIGVGGGVSINDHECGMAGLEAVGLAPKDVPPDAIAAKAE